MEKVGSKFNILLNKNIYCIEKEYFGNSIFILKDLIFKNLNKGEDTLLISHIIKTIGDSLNISKKHGRSQGYVHLYLDDCGKKNFSFGFFKKIHKMLSTIYEDSLVELYIYTNSKFFSLIWPLLKQFIDPDTQAKIKIIRR
jgi:hypothetical protein|tara:strand:+ start:6129 stop:6551 length:423 start_codon:yes stop_codon:yes gene_type:complete